MTEFEKIEKLREHANVTFEEAKQALDAANGDMLDAMIWLERHGKVNGPAQSVHSTKYEDQTTYTSVSEKVKKSTDSDSTVGSKIKNALKSVWRFLTDNSFVVSRKNNEIVVMPLLVLVVLLLFLPPLTIITLIVLLFLGFRYSFHGVSRMEGANDFMDKASDAATDFAAKVREDFR